jgi:uncharacterized protein (TIGR03790 family)
MRFCTAILGLTLSLAGGLAAAVAPESVAVLYNTAVPESRELAEFYRQNREIPVENLIGLSLPITADISRASYEKELRDPLRREFDRRGWWKLGRDANGIVLPVENRIRVLVCLHGVPLRIQGQPRPPGPDGQPAPPLEPGQQDEASVDSELALFAVRDAPPVGALQNPYFRNPNALRDGRFPHFILTARIDASSPVICRRMLEDALETEKTGLWGMAYIDVANKFPQGDQWLEEAAKTIRRTGIPTVIDRFDPTLPPNYPMSDAALYLGWYDWHANGPLLNPRFRFRPGAVAVHIHSFSAQQLTNPTKNWCAPLLEKGAAATLGNVFEPYLHLTHHLDTFTSSLIEGLSLVEAAWLSMPVASWQGIVLGDPLYRPFRHLDGGGEVTEEDRPYRAVRAAVLRWPDDPIERERQLTRAAERMKSPILTESIGLELSHRGIHTDAIARFRQARQWHDRTENRIRQDLHITAIHRSAGRKEEAIATLREARQLHGPLPETEALKAWLDQLDPPPPPPAPPAPTPPAPTPPAGG